MFVLFPTFGVREKSYTDTALESHMLGLPAVAPFATPRAAQVLVLEH